MRLFFRFKEFILSYFRMFREMKECKQYIRTLENFRIAPFGKDANTKAVMTDDFKAKRKQLRRLRIKLEFERNCERIIKDTN